MALKLTTAPTSPAVLLADAKLHLRKDGTDEDALITSFIQVATEAAEHNTGRALMPQQWTLSLDAFPQVIALRRVPVTQIVSIKYDDTNGVEQTLSPTLYELHNSDEFSAATIVPAYDQSWPGTLCKPDAVRVVFAAGYADATKIPESIKAWMKLLIGSLYENREGEVIGPGSVLTLGFVDRLLDRYKVY
jgi:uncharacterized phiE125 gp8 family phage protein